MVSFSARTLHLSAYQVDLLDSAPTTDEIAGGLLRTLVAHPPRLEAEILAVKRVGPGAGVSYGHTFRTATETTLALVAIGYGHGLPRKAGNRASATWNGQRMPIVGRVAMDVLVVEAGELPVTTGEWVVFFGDPGSAEIPLAEWSASVAENPFSVLACLDHRVTRVVTA